MTKSAEQPAFLPARAAFLGALTGMRSMAAPLLLGTYWQSRAHPPALPFPFALLTTPQVGALLKAALLGEMVLDKAPFIPNRTDPLPLLGRLTIGAGSGVALFLANDDSPATGALAGALGALVSSVGMYYLRRYATHALRLPDFAVALAEDGLVVGSGWWFLNE